MGKGRDDDALFDMISDPRQTTNIITQHPEIIASMRSFYEQWWKDTMPLMVNERVPLSPTRPFHVHYEAQKKTRGIPRWNPPKL